MSRLNQVLAVALVFQLVVVVVAFWPRSASVAETEPLFAGLETDQIVQVTISSADGEQIRLTKGADGWVLPAAGDYPGKKEVVPNLLEKIAALQTERLVTQTRSSHKRLKVADQDFQHAVEFELADGTAHKLYLGSAPSYSVMHIRADGQDEVYLASGLSSADVSVRASTWIDTLYFSVPQDQVVAVTLENKSGRLEFQKDAAGTWTMSGLGPGEALDQNSVTSLVNRAASVRMLTPLGKEQDDAYGFARLSATVTIQTKNEEGTVRTDQLVVGARNDEDGSYVVKSSTSPYYARVAEYTVTGWVENARDSFLELPPTPAADESS